MLGGIIGALARKFTKRGEPYAQFRLEGLTGGVEVVAFPSVYEAVPDLFETDRIVLVTGRIDRRGRELQIRASEVKEPPLDTRGYDRPGRARRRPARRRCCSPGVLNKLKTLLEGSPGDVPVRLRFLSSAGRAAAVAWGRSRSTGRARCSTSSVTCSGRHGGAARTRARLRAADSAAAGSCVDAVHAAARDRRDGRRARALHRPTGPAPLDAFGGDPLPAARPSRRGARWLHVVDMDLAFGGTRDEPRGRSGPSRRCRVRRVQASGGVRTGRAGRRAPRGRAPPGWCVASAALADEDVVDRDPRASTARRDGARHRGRGRADPRTRRRAVDLELRRRSGGSARRGGRASS